MGYPVAYRRSAVRPTREGGFQPLARPEPRPRPKPDNDNRPGRKGANDNFPMPRVSRRDNRRASKLFKNTLARAGGIVGFAAGVAIQLDWIFDQNILVIPGGGWVMTDKCAGRDMSFLKDASSACVNLSASVAYYPYVFTSTQSRFDIASALYEDPPPTPIPGQRRFWYQTHSKWSRTGPTSTPKPYMIPTFFPYPWQDPFFKPNQFPDPIPYPDIPLKPRWREWPQEPERGPAPRPRFEDRPRVITSPDTRVEFEPPRKPPGPREKERKFRLTINGTVIGDIVSAVGEGVEYVEVFYEALPEDIRKAFERSFKGKVTSQKKFEAVYEYFDKLDVGKVVEGLIENYAEDKFFGTVGKYMADASGRFNKLGGFQLGPAM